MKKFRVLLALMLSLVFALSGCTGVQNDDSDVVTLRWMYGGTEGYKDADKVFALFNEKLAEILPGVQVEFVPVEGSAYTEKWKLWMTAGEQIDIAWLGYSLNYLEQISNGVLMPLNDLLDEYGQDIKAELPEWIWKIAEANGTIYCIPNYQMMNVMRLGLYAEPDVWHAAMTDEIEQDIINTTNSHKVTVKEDFEAIERYLENIKAHDQMMAGVYPTSIAKMGFFKGYELLIDQNLPIGILRDGSDYTVMNVYEQDSMKLTFKTMREWFEKGYIRSDIASNPSSTIPSCIGIHGFYDLYNQEYDDKYWIPLEPDFFIPSAINNTSSVIPVTAKYPVEAMKLLNIMNTDKGAELMNIIIYGIEGEHYVKVGDNRVDTAIATDEKTGEVKYGEGDFIFGNIFNAYENDDNPVGWKDYLENEVNANATLSPVMGFKADLSNISTEISQFTAVLNEFDKPLKQGTVADWEGTYNEMLRKMEVAGSKKIIAEIQKQLDEWLAKNK